MIRWKSFCFAGPSRINARRFETPAPLCPQSASETLHGRTATVHLAVAAAGVGSVFYPFLPLLIPRRHFYKSSTAFVVGHGDLDHTGRGPFGPEREAGGVMRGKLTLVAGLVVTTVLTSVGTRAEEPPQKRTVPARSYSRFEFETETHKGYWGELGAFLESTDIKPSSVPNTNVDVDTITAFARFAYGGENWEANLFLPYRNIDGKLSRSGAPPLNDFSEDGIGDIEVTGRYIPLRTSILDAGIGANLRLPSGDKDTGIPPAIDPVRNTTSSVDPGTPAEEFAALPFFTASFDLAIVDVRGHIGWQFFTGDNDDGVASDRLVYGFGVIMPMRDLVPFGDYFSIRNEFTSVEFDERDTADIANYLVGFDIRIPVGNMDVLLRPTGLVPISRRAPDWGIGGSIAITAPTYIATKKVQMVGGVVVEE